MPIPGLEKNIGVLLEKSAAQHGAKKAMLFDHENTAFTYAELNTRVNQFANVFVAKGIKQKDHVAVMLPNCPDFPVTWLALAKLGAVMVPLNVRYQAAELEYVLNDSNASAIVIHADFTPVLNRARGKTPGVKTVFAVDSDETTESLNLPELANQASPKFNSADLTLDDIINIQYTSGTTGFPKGCILTHEYWLTIGKTVSEYMNDEDVFLSVTPFYYMDPQWELVSCLIVGATMVLTRSYSPATYMDLVRKYEATVSWATMAPWILKQPPSEQDRRNKLRFLLVGGFPPDLHRMFEERFDVIAREAYGMTEIGPGMFVPPEDDFMTGSGSVGIPFESRHARIVDGDDNEVPQGEIGELWIKGPGMFKGYYNKPKETAEAFDKDWFKTGDLFRQDEKGYFYIVGRKKDMIRRSGDNISASELEDVLTSHPKIMSAAAVPVPDVDRGEEVKVYVVPISGESPDSVSPEEIVAFCRDRIASFKVPRYIEYKKEFSLTPSGKIQKHVLLAEKEDLTTGCYDRLKEG
ncbi:MAG: acyl--CoA ligase [Proteobacteria bacterium]|nr:acyl--CoA ligase [Pseudomonadota bacterium]